MNMKPSIRIFKIIGWIAWIAWIIGVGAYVSGVLFKILHWQGANQLLLLGLCGLGVGFITNLLQIGSVANIKQPHGLLTVLGFVSFLGALTLQFYGVPHMGKVMFAGVVMELLAHYLSPGEERAPRKTLEDELKDIPEEDVHDFLF